MGYDPIGTNQDLERGSSTLRDADGYLHVECRGFFDAHGLGDHFGRLGTALAERRRAGPLKVLVDLRRASVQSRATTETIGEMSDRVYAREDVVAIVAHGALQASQARRVHANRRFRLFQTLEDAAAYLASA